MRLALRVINLAAVAVLLTCAALSVHQSWLALLFVVAALPILASLVLSERKGGTPIALLVLHLVAALDAGAFGLFLLRGFGRSGALGFIVLCFVVVYLLNVAACAFRLLAERSRARR